MWVIQLTDWYTQNKREMPWRTAPSPYKTWISEMMLQQTQVATVIPYFNRFISRFPTVEKLATADLQEVLKLWEGLGYYSRARNLHKAAKILLDSYSSVLPLDYIELQKLPGIGPYSAAAITSIAYETAIPVVDGNVLRVFCRFWGIFDDIRKPAVRNMLFDKLSAYITKSTPSIFNQAIMELGALVCTPSSPKCTTCPITDSCFAFQQNKQKELPFKSTLPKVPHYNIAVAVIWKNGKVLIGKRKETQMLGGLWEFPGGKQNEEESLEDTVIREVKEETDLTVSVEHLYSQVNHAYSHFKITLHGYKCSYVSGKEKAKTTDEIVWVSLKEFEKYPFPKANKKLIESILLSEKK
jgi:A/G-specific adenine glycosylase